MKYICGITKTENEAIKDLKLAMISLPFLSEHRHLFIGDSFGLVNNGSQATFNIKSLKYSANPEPDAIRLGVKDSGYFTTLELEKIYGE